MLSNHPPRKSTIGGARALGMRIQSLSGQDLNEARYDWAQLINRIGWFVAGMTTSYLAMQLVQMIGHGI